MLGTAALAGGWSLAAPPQEGAQIAWMSDVTAAQKQAKESGKPLFVIFRCER